MTSSRWGLVVCGLLAASRAAAGEAQSDLAFFENETPWVSIAAKREEPLLTAPGTVYVVTETDIRRYGWRTVKDVLSALPGMDLQNSYRYLDGGHRGFGFDFSETILMIDGREIHSPIDGRASFIHAIPTFNVKQVEVLQGPNSTLYGGHATGGVINIITKTAVEKNEDFTTASLMAGTVDSQEASLAYRKSTGRAAVGVSAQYFYSGRDWETLKDAVYSQDVNRTKINAYRDYNRNNFRNFERDHNLSAHVRLGDFYAGANYIEPENTGFSGGASNDYSGNSRRVDLRLLYGGWRRHFGEGWNAKVELQNYSGRQQLNFKDLIPGAVPAGPYESLVATNTFLLVGEDYSFKRNYVQSQLSGRLPRHRFVVGLDGWLARFQAKKASDKAWENVNQAGAIFPNQSADLGWPNRSSRKFSAYLQDEWAWVPERLKLIGGVRYNHEDFTKDSWLPRGALVVSPTPASALKLTYGTGYRPPAFQQFAVSSRDLQAQRMRMYEINYSQNVPTRRGLLSNSLSWFDMKSRDQISRIGNNSLFSYINTGEKRIKGWEELLKVDGGQTSGFISFQYVLPPKTLVAGREIVDRLPRWKGKLGISHQATSWLRAGAFVDHWAKADAKVLAYDPANAYPAGWPSTVYVVKAWTTVNVNLLFGEFPFGDVGTFDVALLVENAGNTTYGHPNLREGSTPIEVRQPGRAFSVRTQMRF
jgi:outer membrane receptor protein involved in Fe transport